jgi:hypothetical protein
MVVRQRDGKALTHLTEVVARGDFVEVRFADLRARRCGFPTDFGPSSATVGRRIE